jgi:hypothetical protein
VRLSGGCGQKVGHCLAHAANVSGGPAAVIFVAVEFDGHPLAKVAAAQTAEVPRCEETFRPIAVVDDPAFATVVQPLLDLAPCHHFAS